MKLLLIKVEIVIGRLRAAFQCDRVGCRFRKMCPEQKYAFMSWIVIGNDKSAKINTFYINDFESLLAKFLRQELSVDGQVKSALGG